MGVCAIIAAAGHGRRMGSSISKQFINIKNKPILVHTIEKFCQSKLVDSICIVVSKDWYSYVTENIIGKFDLRKIDKILIGGTTRQESIYIALKEMENKYATVAIHDAVRPLINLELLNKVIVKGQQTGAAVLAVPVQESVKEVAGNLLKLTLNRETVWLVQTPQVYKKEIIFNAYQQAFFNCINATDDSELVEHLGYPIHVVEGSRINIKITTPEDLDLATYLLSKAN